MRLLHLLLVLQNSCRLILPLAMLLAVMMVRLLCILRWPHLLLVLQIGCVPKPCLLLMMVLPLVLA
jgi:hypothetical protein